MYKEIIGVGNFPMLDTTHRKCIGKSSLLHMSIKEKGLVGRVMMSQLEASAVRMKKTER